MKRRDVIFGMGVSLLGGSAVVASQRLGVPVETRSMQISNFADNAVFRQAQTPQEQASKEAQQKKKGDVRHPSASGGTNQQHQEQSSKESAQKKQKKGEIQEFDKESHERVAAAMRVLARHA